MNQLNYHHLYYFYVVAREGSIASSAKTLNITPQTVSSQIAVMEEYFGNKLFDRVGKRLVLNELGHLAFSYAEDIFSLGQELTQILSNKQVGHQIPFHVGVLDVIPKVFAFDTLKECFDLDVDTRMICQEGDFEYLLSELALNRLDLIVSDRPLPPNVGVKAYSHYLGETGLSFFASRSLGKLSKNFPQCLDGAPFLIPGERSAQRNNLMTWFEQSDIHPNIVAEFDDSALMKFFGQAGHGIFCSPTSIEPFVLTQFKVQCIGRTTDITERYYGISPERKIKHPAVEKIFNKAKTLMKKNT